jgi:tRNA(Ser,Leu) C12 N-acetylase TAN1
VVTERREEARTAPDGANLLVSFLWPMPGRARRAVVGRLRALGDPAPVAHRPLSQGVLAARTTLDPHAVVRALHAVYQQDPHLFANISRWVPVDQWTTPDLRGMEDVVRELRDRIALHETWRLTVEPRPGSLLGTVEVIQALAPLVEARVDLTRPDKILLVDVFADRAALTVVTPAEVLSMAPAAPGRRPPPSRGGPPLRGAEAMPADTPAGTPPAPTGDP